MSEDLDLVRALARGEGQALDALLRRHLDAVVRVTRVVAGDDSAALDAAQEAFIRLWRDPAAFAGGSLRAWLITVARRVALNEHRGNTRRAARNETATPRTPSDPELKAADAEHLANVMAFLDTLPELERTALTLFAVEGMSQSEIAAMVGTSEGAVKQAVLSARRKLRARFEL
ncbi:MAG: RNA polymerase sigma factor [Planctomycetes bacterium]|nr:RNA polymerase sigma factor [Planctomycetota bacterium]MCL4729043.1 RNA polymerase sigma factor [Planctomycetota bacterium]